MCDIDPELWPGAVLDIQNVDLLKMVLECVEIDYLKFYECLKHSCKCAIIQKQIWYQDNEPDISRSSTANRFICADAKLSEEKETQTGISFGVGPYSLKLWMQLYSYYSSQPQRQQKICWLLNIGRVVLVSNETNTDVGMYIEEFILVDIWIHCCTSSKWRCTGNAVVYIQTQQ